jgi:3-oxoacyl-[acyl-carrier protein] reductase
VGAKSARQSHRHVSLRAGGGARYGEARHGENHQYRLNLRPARGIGRAAYGAAKAGVIQLTRVMAVELAPLGIGVNAISPGPVDTEQSRGTHTPATRRAYLSRIPQKRYGEGSEVAAAAVFLASDDASFVAGHVLNVDGGFDAAGLIFDDEELSPPKP